MDTGSTRSRRERTAGFSRGELISAADRNANSLWAYRFPLGDPDRLDQWVLNIRRNKWTPNVSSRLCSAHFESHPFSTDSWGRRCLKNTAVPTIFYFTKEHQPGRKSRPADETVENMVQQEDSTLENRVPPENITSPSSPDVVAPDHVGDFDISESLYSGFDNSPLTSSRHPALSRTADDSSNTTLNIPSMPAGGSSPTHQSEEDSG
ncbi:hypothetical protein CgunFtcFv8_007714 [Champsocephalus gunnari]|uniref:THAP-type domain-containing protein n=1 Tax=Champsocephalus gunnari TaxID=52237 RepID=A0AAN8CKU1_CHAGU|nr:hypothetical protein CgunFtcFv8_007714 [Champsocephalus gunnari]